MSFFDGLNPDLDRTTGEKIYAQLRSQGLSPEDAYTQTNSALTQLGMTALAPPQEVKDVRNQTGGNTSQYDPTTGQLLPPGSTKPESVFAAGSGGLYPNMNASGAQYIVAHADQYNPNQVAAARALLQQTDTLTGAGGGVGQNIGLSQTDPAKYKMLQMHLGALNLQAYRPEMEQSRVNSLQNQLGAYKPMNNALTSMYGPGAALDLTARSPLTPGQTSIGAPNQNDIGLSRPPPPPGQQPVGPQVHNIMRLLRGQ